MLSDRPTTRNVDSCGYANALVENLQHETADTRMLLDEKRKEANELREQLDEISEKLEKLNEVNELLAIKEKENEVLTEKLENALKENKILNEKLVDFDNKTFKVKQVDGDAQYLFGKSYMSINRIYTENGFDALC